MAGAVVGARSKGVNMTRVLAVLGIVCLLSSGAMAQYFGRLLGQPWSDDDRATTYDHPMIEDGGHVNNDSSDTSVFAWDSFGRVRLNRQDQDSPIVGYRVLTIGLGTETPAFKASMDELENRDDAGPWVQQHASVCEHERYLRHRACDGGKGD
jgi:hypothetical protein